MMKTANNPSAVRADIADLRDSALRYLDAGPDGALEFDPQAALTAFEALSLSPEEEQSPDALEAFIALVVAHGRRPRRAQKSLYRLYQHRTAARDAGAFVAFQDQIAEAGENGFSTEGLNFFSSLADVDQQQLWRDTATAIRDVQDVFGPAFLNSGTLLGAIRDKSFIAHDDDVDIAVLMKAQSAEAAAREWTAGYATLRDRGLIKKPPRRNLGVFKLKSATGINIDVFPAWIEDDRLNVYPHTFGELSRDDLLPLATCATTGLPIPRNAVRMLEVNYGPGWRTPDPGFQFDWKPANQKFRNFRVNIGDLE